MPDNSRSKLSEENPFFSIIILYWKNKHYLFTCLDSLLSQIEKDFEILILDNGSPEPVGQNEYEKYSELNIKTISLKTNLGFAAGNNIAAANANGKYIVLLNSDAFPYPDWLVNIRRGIKKYPDGFFASKLIMANHPERYDGMGDVYHASGLVWRKSYNTPISPSLESEKEVFSACGAAAVYPNDAFKQVNGFDADYFSYVEDVDLGFRLRLAGYRCIFLPNAIVEHVGSGSTSYRSDFSVYYGQRNLVWTFIKDMPGIFVWLLAPVHFLANILQIILALFRKQTKITLKAKIDAMKKLPSIIEKRKAVQKSRNIPIMQIIQRMDWNPISPLIKLFQR
jgi:GT2 family glycosyltransferase